MESFDETYSRPRVNSKARAKRAPKKDWLVSLSAAQLSLAVLGVAVLLLLMRFAPASFNTLKAEFNRIMQVDMSASQVVSRLKELIVLEEKTEKNEAETTLAAGGEDVEVYAADENICFAPLSSTVEITVPVAGEITSRFGYRIHPITGVFGIHNGTDIAADEGTPIAAAMSGRVEEIGYNDVRGNYILLSHGGETKTLYLHCSEIIAPEGANVRSGEIIAKVGSTGWSTGAHLHFSVIVGGKYCNPEWLLGDL